MRDFIIYKMIESMIKKTTVMIFLDLFSTILKAKGKVTHRREATPVGLSKSATALYNELLLHTPIICSIQYIATAMFADVKYKGKLLKYFNN